MPIKNIIYRVDGGSKLGFGHIKRAITLNKIFYKKKINFYVKKEVEGFNYIKKFIKNAGLINNEIEKQILIKATNTLIIFDTLLLNKSILEKINLKTNKLIVFEDLKMISKNYANLIINAIVDGPIHREIKIKNGKKLSGSIFKIYHKPEKIIKKEKIITICFGGGNFPKLTYMKCINNLLKVEKLKNYRIICIIGPGSKILKKDLKSHRRLKILNDVNNLDRFLAKSKIFIGGGGGTIDTTLKNGSTNAVTNNAVFDGLATKLNLTGGAMTGLIRPIITAVTGAPKFNRLDASKTNVYEFNSSKAITIDSIIPAFTGQEITLMNIGTGAITITRSSKGQARTIYHGKNTNLTINQHEAYKLICNQNQLWYVIS